MYFLLIATVSFFAFLVFTYWKNRQIYNLAKQFTGPPALPLIGNGLQLMCKNEDVLDTLSNLMRSYPHPMRLWAGTSLTIIFTNPSHVEKILSSPKFLQKHKLYNLMKSYLGEGLVTASGPVYKKNRKLIQPMLSLQFFNSNFDAFSRHSKILISKLDQHVNQEEFNVLSPIHMCLIDIVGETILGTQIKSQQGTNLEFVDDVVAMYNIAVTRLAKPWLYPDLLYKLTSYSKKEKYYMTNINGFLDEICQDSYNRVSEQEDGVNENSPIIDQINAYRRKNHEFMNDVNFRYHMLTLYAASEDTISVTCAFAVLCLGMYPEYQEKLVAEIFEVLGRGECPIKLEDLKKLHYLDMCIKEVLRLFPIGPYILRECTEDCQIDTWCIPKGISVMIPIFDIHRDGAYWKNPDHFYPDHFLPDVVSQRPIYAYVPFSAGPRGCIGKTFANIGLKVILIEIFRHFEIEAKGDVANLKLKMDISTRSVNGYNVKLKRRSL